MAGPGRLALAAGDLFAAAGIERAFALAQELGAAAPEGEPTELPLTGYCRALAGEDANENNSDFFASKNMALCFINFPNLQKYQSYAI